MSDVLTLASPNEQTAGIFGRRVSGAGDVDQDGYPDLIVGAHHEDPGNSPDRAGRAYVFSGQDGTSLSELVSPNEMTNGIFGSSVAGAGDVDHDGSADLIVGAPGEFAAGRAYVFGGQDGSVLFELSSPNAESSGEFGETVAGADDVNQDGFADFIVGAEAEDPGNSPDRAGRAYVFSGLDGGLLYELVSPNEQSSGRFGFAVDGAGDVNRDGSADLVVGARDEDGGQQDSGRAYIFSGSDGSVLFQLVSPNPEELGHFGISVAGAGDVNRDGFAEVIVGASNELNSHGRAYVFSGQDGSVLFELVSPNGGFVSAFADAVAGAGDVNQDGTPDLLVASLSEFGGSGRAYIFSGQDGGVLVELVSPNEEPNGNFGAGVGAAGDVNQDGVADVIVGAPSEDPGNSPPDAGRAYVFLSPSAFRINSGGPDYTDASGSLFVADRAYAPGGFGHVGGVQRRFNQPIGGTEDDPLYQDVRIARQGADGNFAYRFDVATPSRYDVTLHLMAPALEGAGSVVMDVRAEEDLVFDDLDVTAEAGGEYQALVKTFAVDVEDGRLDLRFRAVNKAAVVSAIAVVPQGAGVPGVARRPSGDGR